MKIWNFKKQNVEEGVEPPACNGLSGGDYNPVLIDYNKDGEIKIVSIKDKNKWIKKI